MTRIRVGLEEGRTWSFASAVDWPGWCRRGEGRDGAVEALEAYRDRYAAAVGPPPPVGRLEVVGTVPGGTGTDFGAPMEPGPWDAEPLDPEGAERLARLLVATWSCFDAVVAGAPGELRKGPRGGGRDRDAIVDHVREAERAYGRKFGVRVPPRTPWPEQRQAIATAVRETPAGTPWPIRYAVRRVAWHVLDHAWEIEDRS